VFDAPDYGAEICNFLLYALFTGNLKLGQSRWILLHPSDNDNIVTLPGRLTLINDPARQVWSRAFPVVFRGELCVRSPITARCVMMQGFGQLSSHAVNARTTFSMPYVIGKITYRCLWSGLCERGRIGFRTNARKWVEDSLAL